MKQKNNKPGEFPPKNNKPGEFPPKNGFETIKRVVQVVFENPDIKSKDRRKVVAELLDPMIKKLFGSDYEKR